MLDQAEGLLGNHDSAKTAFHTLRTIRRLLDESGVPEDAVMFDMGLARGLDYYTGVVMETTVNGWEKFGSISSGGGTTIWEVSSVSGGFPVWGHPLGLTD